MLKVLRVWEQWSIYPQEYLDRLVNTFLNLKPSVAAPAPTPVAGAEEEDIDGVPRKLLLIVTTWRGQRSHFLVG